MNVTIHHWRFESGEPTPAPEWLLHVYPSGFMDTAPRGWYCWAYSDNCVAFEEWMEENMKHDYDADRRFNSGDPMIAVHITNEEDATLFKLRWV